MTSKAVHLHPIALIFFFYSAFKDAIFPIALSILGIINTKAKNWIMLIIIAIALIILLITFLRYLMFTYQITTNEIIVISGIFEKKVNHVPYDRIQNITTNQWFFLKPFNLTELEIETAGHSDKAEVQLQAVPTTLKEELDRLRKPTKLVDPEEIHNDSANTYAISWGELLKFSFTTSAFLSGLLVVLAIYGKLQHVISQQIYQTATNEFSHLGLLIAIVVVVIVLLLFYLASVLVLISQYYHFQVTETDNNFEMTRGFFQTKKTSLSRKRIQAVIIKQTLLRKWLQIATIQLVIISNSSQGDTEKNIVVMPMISVSKIDDFLQQFFADIPITKIDSKPLSWTFYYNLRNATIFALITTGLIIWLLHRLIWPCMILIIIELLGWYIPAILTSQRSKIKVEKNFLIAQNNHFMTKNLTYIPKNTIQFLERRTSIWLKKKQLAGLTVYIRSGNAQHKLKVDYISANEIDLVLNWYKN